MPPAPGGRFPPSPLTTHPQFPFPRLATLAISPILRPFPAGSWRNRPLSDPELIFFTLTSLGLALGCFAIIWARISRKQICILVGRCLFLATLCLLPASGVGAATGY